MYLDACWCFDLMVEVCHNMACRRHGAADDYLRLHAQTHRSLKYYVRYKYGVSEEFNTFDQNPWHGAGQGAADAALRYITLSDSLIDAYHSKIQPWAIHDPTLTLTVFKSMKAFIDDVAMSVNGDQTSFEMLTQHAEQQLQWWTRLIQSSGGALNPSKCCCAFYTWTPDSNGILRFDTNTYNDVAIAPCNQQPQQTIKILKPRDGTRYLGTYVTRTGDTKPMQEHIWGKALLYTKAFQRTHMSRREAGVLYRSCFLPALTYSFPAIGLPPTFLERIHKLSTSTILNKMGYHRNLPRSFVFAPRNIGGIGLCNLIYEQSAQQTIILLRHMRAHTPLGLAIEVLIRTYQLWAGIRNHVLSDTQPCPWIPNQWLSFLRQSMHQNQIKITYQSWTIPPLRLNDRFLMEDFNDQNFSRMQLERLNACRMYLQVTTLSEITDHTGSELMPQVLLLRPNEPPKGLLNISFSTLQWPLVHCPSISCWRFWNSTIRNLYTGSAKGTRLNHPLGPWLPSYADYRFWHWRLHDASHLVYRNTPTAPTRVALSTMCRRTMQKFSPTVPTTLDFTGPPVTPVDPTIGQVRLPISMVSPIGPVPPQPILFTTLQQQFRASIPQWQLILFGSLRKAYTTPTLYRRLLDKQPILLVSDASVQNNGQSGFAWVIAQDATPMWRGMGLAPGPTEDMYSGRAEAFGLYAAICFLQYYILCFQPLIPPTTISCYCDNLGVITMLTTLTTTSETRPNDTTNDDRDIYMAIKEAATICPALKFQYWHVKGHQDRDPKHPLTTEEQHNVDCDNFAKKFVRAHPQRSSDLPNPEFTVAAPHLRIAGKLICRQVLPALRQAAAIPPYWDYLRRRFTWTHSDLRSIQWDTFKTALNSFLMNDQRRLVLFIHDKLALRTSKFHPHLGSTLCPSCQREPEDFWHFLECQNLERRRLFSQLQQDLAALTVKYSLHPAILTTFWLGMLSVRNDTPYPDVQADLPSVLRSTINAQNRLGWDQLFQGRVTHLWEQAIE